MFSGGHRQYERGRGNLSGPAALVPATRCASGGAVAADLDGPDQDSTSWVPPIRIARRFSDTR
jgi:hypothetical protein